MKTQKMLYILGIASLSISTVSLPAQSGLEVCFRHTLGKVRNESKIPALGGVLVFDGKIQAAGATGVRKEGTNFNVTDNDRFPIGSISKTFTALVIAKAIQNSSQVIAIPQQQQQQQQQGNGPLSWGTKIKDIFPALAQEPGIQLAYLDKSLAEITTHQSGLPRSGSESSICDKSDFIQYMFCGRNEHMLKNLKLTPEPNSDYSNLGPVIATNMIQKKTNKTWETLVAEYIYNPLQMGAGFISTYDYANVKDPMFHQNNGAGNVPIAYSQGDRYNVAAPAGHVAISPRDMGKYLVELMPGAPGRVGILNNPNLDLYLNKLNNLRNVTRGGWMVTNAGWAPNQKVLWHNGSHGKNYAHAWLLPDSKIGFCAMTNVQGNTDIGKNAVNRMNENLKLMYLNRNILGLFTPQMEAFNYQLSSVGLQINQKSLNDGELASRWTSSMSNSTVDVAVGAQAAVAGIVVCYAGASHNIKEVQIYALSPSNQETLLHKGAPGTYQNIYEFGGGSLQGSKVRFRFINQDGKQVEVNEIMVLQNTQRYFMAWLGNVPKAEKTSVFVPLNKVSN
ncbi:serine hydrolase domain-containing protein [Haliscomenobacter sp.]|uniref:serine hydrolase domain-containing protein n=1 Tax=Haliscomenobacter sp. TaxID=2717303 RepID=UPI0035942704